MGDIRSENDANCTYEGENNVLIQQTSNWLLSQWGNVLQGKRVQSPLGSADFLEGAQEILSMKFHCTSIDQTMQLDSKFSLFIFIFQRKKNVFVEKTLFSKQFLNKKSIIYRSSTRF